VGIRETLNKNPGITTGVTAGVILLALVIIIWQAGGGGGLGSGTVQGYYTVDDGATFFEEDIRKVPPFDHNGQTAYRAYVYTCDDGATKKVSHLERYSPEAKKAIEQMQSGEGGEQAYLMMEELTMTGLEVKPPGTGDKGWIRQADPRSAKIVLPQCPEGATLRWLHPN
jgi:hypothetical protein